MGERYIECTVVIVAHTDREYMKRTTIAEDVEIGLIGGMKMIEIKCDELQRESIIDALMSSDYCLIGCNVDCANDSCYRCMMENIKWTIRGNEDES